MLQAIGNRLAYRSALLLVAVVLATPAAHAARIELTDGSVVDGDIRSLRDGVYVIDSNSLGTIEIDQDEVAAIRYGDSDTNASGIDAAGSEAVTGERIERLQRRVIQSGSLMERIQALRNDPEVRAALEDPEIQRALANGNYQALMSHPKIQALTEHPEIEAITDEVAPEQR